MNVALLLDDFMVLFPLYHDHDDVALSMAFFEVAPQELMVGLILGRELHELFCAGIAPSILAGIHNVSIFC